MRVFPCLALISPSLLRRRLSRVALLMLPSFVPAPTASTCRDQIATTRAREMHFALHSFRWQRAIGLFNSSRLHPMRPRHLKHIRDVLGQRLSNPPAIARKLAVRERPSATSTP